MSIPCGRKEKSELDIKEAEGSPSRLTDDNQRNVGRSCISRISGIIDYMLWRCGLEASVRSMPAASLVLVLGWDTRKEGH